MKYKTIIRAGVLIALGGGVLWIALQLQDREAEKLAVPEKKTALSTEAKERIRHLWETYVAANSAQRAGETERAIELYREVVRINPRHEDALYALGNIYFERDEFDLALKAFEQLRTVYPQSARAHYQLGLLYSTVEPGAPLNLHTAYERFKGALAINPEESGPFTRLARLHVQMGHWKEAKSEATLALKRNPKSYEASHTLGLVALYQGQIADATSHFARAIVLYRGDQPIGGILGEGDTEATMGAFDLADPRIVRDLFALNVSGKVAGSFPDKVPAWVRWKGTFLPQGGAFFTSKTIPESGGHGTWIDVNGDTAPDLVVAGGPITVFQNDGHGNLSSPRLLVPDDQEGDYSYAFAVSAGDVNGDGYEDLFAIGAGWTGTGRDRLLMARKGDTFEDVTADWGLDGVRATASALFADINGDGNLDLILGLSRPEDGRTLQVWLNRGSRFEPVKPSQLPEMTAPVVGISAGDVDNDQAAEIFVSFWGARGRLLDSEGHKGLIDITSRAGLMSAPVGMASQFFDFDQDGDLDLFSAGYPSHEDTLRARFKAETPPNTPVAYLFRQVSPGKFEETKGVIPLLYAGVMEIASGDFNGDGWLDLYLACGGFEIDHFEPDILLVNRGGNSFAERLPLSAFKLPGKSIGLAASDFNQDGLPDLYIARSGILPGDRRAGQILQAVKGTEGGKIR